jgi:hypothetical protein
VFKNGGEGEKERIHKEYLAAAEEVGFKTQ